MSRETADWLNTMTLIGFTDKRGDAWHHRQGANNHYPGAIPIDDVKHRLFDWTPERVVLPMSYSDGRQPMAILHSETHTLLGIFSESYPAHGYIERLLEATANIIDDDLQVASAGLLRGGARAWVQVEVPDSIVMPDGSEYRPFIVAMSSLDGTLASTYKAGVTRVVCDNTLDMFRAEDGMEYKVINSKNSILKIRDAREALGIIHAAGGAFERELQELLRVSVTSKGWEKILHKVMPVPEKKSGQQTRAIERHELLTHIYGTDPRVAPWAGTGWGAFQALSTYDQHIRELRGATVRQERNAMDFLRGTMGTWERGVKSTILELATA